jgi:hypothetical protein
MEPLVKRSETISFGSALSIPVAEFASQGNAILGIRDSGKSYTATWLAERLLDNGVPFVAFDPVGIWRYLKVPGRTNASGYNVVVAGEGADLELSPTSAPEIVRAAMSENISLVLDLYSMHLSKRDWRSIVEASVRLLLYENKPHGLRHIFLEEAAEFVPQRIGPDQGSVYAEIEKLARMGGNASLGYTMINQRAEEVNKAVLELCDCLFLHRQKGRNSLTAISKWLDIADAGNRKQIISSLPMLEQGKCWVWPQGTEKPVLVHIPSKRSFHPDRRNPEVTRGRMPVDVSDFVRRLRKALPQVASEPQKTVRQLHQSRRAADIDAGLVETLRKQNEGLRQQLAARDRDLQKISALFRQAVQTYRDLGQTLEILRGRIETRPQDHVIPAPAKIAREPQETPGEGWPTKNSELPKAERKILSVLARHNPEPRPKGGFNNALSRLRTLGMIQGIDPLRLTDAGSNYVAQYKQESMPTGAALAVYWMERSAKAERAILEVLTRPPRRYFTKEAIAIETGYEVTGGGFQNAISRLRTLLLIEGRAEIAASDRLFD